jgi:hypothetical protein
VRLIDVTDYPFRHAINITLGDWEVFPASEWRYAIAAGTSFRRVDQPEVTASGWGTGWHR